MSESELQPEEEKPRYLLPPGCKDLIDAFPKPDPARKLMLFLDHDGNVLGPPLEIPEPESVPMGLSALPGYVSRLCKSTNSFDGLAGLTVLTPHEHHGFGLTRQILQTLVLFFVPTPEEAALEHKVRAFFAARAIKATHDYLANDGATRCIDYLLPQSPIAITAICRDLLTDCFGVQPDETLRFRLNKIA